MKTFYTDIDGKRQALKIRTEIDLINKKTVFQFSGSDPRHCATFGCGKLLTLTETMAGTKCLHCQGSKQTIFKNYKL